MMAELKIKTLVKWWQEARFSGMLSQKTPEPKLHCFSNRSDLPCPCPRTFPYLLLSRIVKGLENIYKGAPAFYLRKHTWILLWDCSFQNFYVLALTLIVTEIRPNASHMKDMYHPACLHTPIYSLSCNLCNVGNWECLAVLLTDSAKVTASLCFDAFTCTF